MLEPVLLQTFLAVAETRSFTQAAERLGLRQSTVSQHIRKLELEAGRRLFVRDTHSVTMTADGEAMTEFARNILAANERAERYFADAQLRDEIAKKTEHWGVSVSSVEIRDVAIPVALQDAMSRQAQAEREKQARVILGSAEAEGAAKFVEAAQTYGDHPMAFQLRAMNIIYETTKERGTTILIPTSMVDSMNPAAALVLAGQAGAAPGSPLKTAA